MMPLVNTFLFLIVVILVVLKARHYNQHIRNKKLINWFYFNRYKIALSSTQESAEAKKKQNTYSKIIVLSLLAIALINYIDMLTML